MDSLLNPCHCKNVWKCKCRAQPMTGSAPPLSGLATLARAAAMCCGGGGSTSLLDHVSPVNPSSPKMPARTTKRHGSRPSTPPGISHKRPKRYYHQQNPLALGPDLPPLLLDAPSAEGSFHSVPTFPSIPPLSAITSIAGSGCTCGLHCACPGCVEHRGKDHASTSRTDCVSGGCTTCVDWSHGVELPSATTAQSSAITAGHTQSIVDQFFARAAALPPPPRNRTRYLGLEIDPANITVYPSDLFAVGSSGSGTEGGLDKEGREAVFGLVKVPKLECCGGRCSCPEGGCLCGKSCDGKCHGDARRHRRSISGGEQTLASSQMPSSLPALPVIAVRSCCAR